MSFSIRLQHAFPGFSLDLAFEAPPGVTILFGPSGAGKTTVLDAVSGLLRPDQGRITAGVRVLVDTERGIFLPPHRRRLGVIFQDGRLFPHLNVRQNLHYGRWFLRKQARMTREEDVIAMLGIGALLRRMPASLSGGERQRVGIGRALLAEPDLILADEPLSALDDRRKAEILPYLERLRDELRVPMLYVSHAPAEVARIATTIVMIEGGRLQRMGRPEQVLSDLVAFAPGRQAGALITGRVSAQHADGVTEIDAGGVALFLPRFDARPGDRLRLRIAAKDVILARERPEGISALNMLPGRIDAVQDAGDTVLVRLVTPAGAILSRVTLRSAHALGLCVGMPMTAILKALSRGPDDIGTPYPTPGLIAPED